MIKLILVGVLVFVSLIIYGFKIEPYRLTSHQYQLNARQEISPFKVVQFSDIHIKEDFNEQQLKKIVAKINSQKPDIVVFTGDLYDDYSVYHQDKQVIEYLSEINAKVKVAVYGNRDLGGGASRHYESIMNQAGFKVLQDTSKVYSINGSKVLISGLDDSMLGSPYLSKKASNKNYDYKILLTHEPDAINNYLDYDYDLVLSGHSHGGQVNIPFIPKINKLAISLTNLASGYDRGFYQIDQDTKLFVNTGIGTTHISFRLGVVPTISEFLIK